MKLLQVYARKHPHQTQQHLGGCSINITISPLTIDLSSKDENTIAQGHLGESTSDVFREEMTVSERP